MSMNLHQCDGCARGLPIVDGLHRSPDNRWDLQACTAKKYEEPTMSLLVAAPDSYGDDIVEIAEKMMALKSDEARALQDYLRDTYAIEAPDFGIQNAIQAPAPVEVVEEQANFDVILKGIDPAKKISVIKIVRAATGLGLAESKAVVEGAPKTIKEFVPKADAEKLKKELEDAGASVELK